jgi:hypothetical protein
MYMIVTAKAVSIKDLAKINKLIPIETSYDEADPKLNYGTINPEFVRILRYLCNAPVGFILASKNHFVAYNWKSSQTLEELAQKMTRAQNLTLYYQVQDKLPAFSIQITL